LTIGILFDKMFQVLEKLFQLRVSMNISFYKLEIINTSKKLDQ